MRRNNVARVGHGASLRLKALPEPYDVKTTVFVEATAVGVELAREGVGRSHPAESQELGMENSDQPQSRQMLMSGEGVIGGWLRVRWQLR